MSASEWEPVEVTIVKDESTGYVGDGEVWVLDGDFDCEVTE